MRILLRLVSTAVALAVAAGLFRGIRFDGHDWQHKLVPLVLVAAILGIVTSFVKPILTFLSIPLIILTLGFFLLVLNALMLKLTSALAGGLGIGFHVHGFAATFFGALVITIVTWIVDGIIGTDDDAGRARRARRSRSGYAR